MCRAPSITFTANSPLLLGRLHRLYFRELVWKAEADERSLVVNQYRGPGVNWPLCSSDNNFHRLLDVRRQMSSRGWEVQTLTFSLLIYRVDHQYWTNNVPIVGQRCTFVLLLYTIEGWDMKTHFWFDVFVWFEVGWVQFDSDECLFSDISASCWSRIDECLTV